MEVAEVYRWDVRKGTGVVAREGGMLAWFHLSVVDRKDLSDLRVGDRVYVEIEEVQQGAFEARAVSVRRCRSGPSGCPNVL
ncbi:hypothetical protein ACFYTQ_10235 [Nocardia sp. NPDC004068]|uniref:hypothetical protein n=1 Tax=Nocardia sp. NPDC004068 TaxID=3364303 RepID=UPI0036A8AA55